MSTNRDLKEQVVSSLKSDLEDFPTMFILHYKGLNVRDLTQLRNNIKRAGGGFKVTKNSLLKRAVVGTNFEKLTSFFSGPTAIAYSSDPVSAAKILSSYAKDNEKLVILGGIVDNQSIDQEKIKYLATLPSLDELRAKIVGVIKAPATKIAGTLVAPAGQLARVTNAYASKQ